MREIGFSELITWFFFAPILLWPLVAIFWLIGANDDAGRFLLWLLPYGAFVAGLFGLGLLLRRLTPESEVDRIEQRWLWAAVAFSTPVLAPVLWSAGWISYGSALQFAPLSLFYSVMIYFMIRMHGYWIYRRKCVDSSHAETD